PPSSARSARAEADHARPLVARETLLAPPPDVALRNVSYDRQLDVVLARRLRDRSYPRALHARHRDHHALDFARVDVESGPCEHRLHEAAKHDRAIVPPLAEVARMQPAVAHE